MQRLVGRDHGLARLEGCLDRRFCRVAFTADELHQDIHVGRRRQLHRIVEPPPCRNGMTAPLLAPGARAHCRHDQGPAGPFCQRRDRGAPGHRERRCRRCRGPLFPTARHCSSAVPIVRAGRTPKPLLMAAPPAHFNRVASSRFEGPDLVVTLAPGPIQVGDDENKYR